MCTFYITLLLHEDILNKRHEVETPPCTSATSTVSSLTREQVLGFEAQVSLGGVGLELNPELWGKHHDGERGSGVSTEPGQKLPI